MNSVVVTDKSITTRVKDIAKRYDDDAELILFGSRARGDYNQDSDYDFLLLTSKDDRKSIEKNIIDDAFDILLETGQIVQIITFPKQEWLKGASPAPIYDVIRTEGITV